MELNAITLRDQAMYQLELIRDLETGVEYLSKVKAIETWARAEKKDAELQNMIAEQKLRTQRILGQLIHDGQERGEVRHQQDKYTGVPVGNTPPPKTLSDIGITAKQSSAFKAIASIPDESFEEFIANKKEAVNKAVSELTTTGAVRLAKTLQERRADNHRVADLNKRLDLERELRNLAIELRKKYKAPQIELLIQFLTK